MEQVLAAICNLPSNGQTVTASLREIVKCTGLSRGSVARTLTFCVEEGWLEPTNNARHGSWYRAANSYRIRRTTENKPSYLWSGHGLGPTAGLIYHAMPIGQWISTIHTSQLSEVTAKTVRKYLQHLMSACLIELDENGQWCRIDDDDYFKRTEERLTGENRKALNRKVREEQIEWKAMDDFNSRPRRQSH